MKLSSLCSRPRAAISSNSLRVGTRVCIADSLDLMGLGVQGAPEAIDASDSDYGSLRAARWGQSKSNCFSVTRRPEKCVLRIPSTRPLDNSHAKVSPGGKSQYVTRSPIWGAGGRFYDVARG